MWRRIAVELGNSFVKLDIRDLDLSWSRSVIQSFRPFVKSSTNEDETTWLTSRHAQFSFYHANLPELSQDFSCVRWGTVHLHIKLQFLVRTRTDAMILVCVCVCTLCCGRSMCVCAHCAVILVCVCTLCCGRIMCVCTLRCGRSMCVCAHCAVILVCVCTLCYGRSMCVCAHCAVVVVCVCVHTVLWS